MGCEKLWVAKTIGKKFHLRFDPFHTSEYFTHFKYYKILFSGISRDLSHYLAFEIDSSKHSDITIPLLYDNLETYNTPIFLEGCD